MRENVIEGVLVISEGVWVWTFGFLVSESLGSFPWQNVLAVVPNEPVVITPFTSVIRGRFAEKTEFSVTFADEFPDWIIA